MIVISRFILYIPLKIAEFEDISLPVKLDEEFVDGVAPI